MTTPPLTRIPTSSHLTRRRLEVSPPCPGPRILPDGLLLTWPAVHAPDRPPSAMVIPKFLILLLCHKNQATMSAGRQSKRRTKLPYQKRKQTTSRGLIISTTTSMEKMIQSQHRLPSSRKKVVVSSSKVIAPPFSKSKSNQVRIFPLPLLSPK